MDGIRRNSPYTATLYIKPPLMRTTNKQVAKNISMRNYMLTITRVLLIGAAILLTAHGVLSANPRSLSGVVQTGGTSSSQPLPNVHVTLFEATTGQPATLGQATTDASGRFSIRYTRSTSQSIFFVKADIGEGVEF